MSDEQQQQYGEENGNNNGQSYQEDGGANGHQSNEAHQQQMSGSEDADLADIKNRVKGMDEEAARLLQLQNEMEQQMKSSGAGSPSVGSGGGGGGQYAAHMSAEEKAEIDARSIYVGNVDYSATAQELEAHFHGCGSINRVTILCDKFTSHPKGFAYVEFGDKDSVQTAMALDESLFKGRQIKVGPKRTNRPGISTTDRGRGRGGYGAAPYGGGGYGGFGGGRGRGGYGGGGAMRGGYSPYGGGGGGGMRGGFRGKPIRGARGGGMFHYAPY